MSPALRPIALQLMREKVGITGAGGRIGGILAAALASEYDLRLFVYDAPINKDTLCQTPSISSDVVLAGWPSLYHLPLFSLFSLFSYHISSLSTHDFHFITITNSLHIRLRTSLHIPTAPVSHTTSPHTPIQLFQFNQFNFIIYRAEGERRD